MLIDACKMDIPTTCMNLGCYFDFAITIIMSECHTCKQSQPRMLHAPWWWGTILIRLAKMRYAAVCIHDALEKRSRWYSMSKYINNNDGSQWITYPEKLLMTIAARSNTEHSLLTAYCLNGHLWPPLIPFRYVVTPFGRTAWMYEVCLCRLGCSSKADAFPYHAGPCAHATKRSRLPNLGLAQLPGPVAGHCCFPLIMSRA